MSLKGTVIHCAKKKYKIQRKEENFVYIKEDEDEETKARVFKNENSWQPIGDD